VNYGIQNALGFLTQNKKPETSKNIYKGHFGQVLWLKGMGCPTDMDVMNR
jgi:hypothetical protein